MRVERKKCNEFQKKPVLVGVEIMLLVLVLILVDIAAWKWGVDSREWTLDDRAITPRPRRAI